MLLKIVPVAIPVRTSCMISSKNIVWMSDPEGSRSLISVEKTPRLFSQYSKIIFDQIVLLYCIFNEESVAFCVVCNIPLNSQVVNCMESDSSVICMMDGVSFDI